MASPTLEGVALSCTEMMQHYLGSYDPCNVYFKDTYINLDKLHNEATPYFKLAGATCEFFFFLSHKNTTSLIWYAMAYISH